MELEKLAREYEANSEYSKYEVSDAFEAGYKTAEKELYTKEDIYNCLGAFAYKYGIVINGNDITKWLKDKEL